MSSANQVAFFSVCAKKIRQVEKGLYRTLKHYKVTFSCTHFFFMRPGKKSSIAHAYQA
jgi:hypothetical protein